MDDVEHERWKRHLEEELEAAFDLVRAGVRAQLRVLDQLRTARVLEAPPGPPSAAGPKPSPPRLPPAAVAPPLATAPIERPKRRPAGELYFKILDQLPQLPEVFDSSELLALLDERPKKSTLHQAFYYLRQNGRLERLNPGQEARPARFRQLAVEEEEDDGEDEEETVEPADGALAESFEAPAPKGR